VRRPGPRSLSDALERVTREAAPVSTLALVQGTWEASAGPVIAAEATPIAERAGTLTVACRSAVWAAELELLAPDLIGRLNAGLPGPSDGPLKALRVRSGARR